MIRPRKLVITSDIKAQGLKGLKERLRSASEVYVGFPAGVEEPAKEGEEKPPTVAFIASVHEFGSRDGTIPERSFMRSSVRENMPKYVALNKKNIKKVAGDKLTMQNALGQLGLMAKGDIQQQIRHGEYKALKPSTIARKKSSRPLIDTGQMIQSVAFVVGTGE